MTAFEQTLASGVVIRQDFRKAVRFAMYETGFEGWDYATHGGTLLVVNVQDRAFGVTCSHILGDFDWRQLVVTDFKFGRAIAGLKAVYRPALPVGDAVGSDVLDLTIIEFAEDVGPGFFGDTAYIFDPGTITSSHSGDKLLVNGAFKAESKLVDQTIAPMFGLLEFLDAGPSGSDPVLRKGLAVFREREFEGLTGLSGSPVFNVTRRRLAGVLARGGIVGPQATMHYIDIAHVDFLLRAILSGELAANYRIAVAN